jgi:hypothetical protein
MVDLLRLLAFQIGQEALSKLASNLAMSRDKINPIRFPL